MQPALRDRQGPVGIAGNGKGLTSPSLRFEGQGSRRNGKGCRVNRVGAGNGEQHRAQHADNQLSHSFWN